MLFQKRKKTLSAEAPPAAPALQQDFSGTGTPSGLGRWLAAITYEERRALVEGETDPRDIFLFTDYKANTRLRLHTGLQFGLTDTTAAIGFLLGAQVLF